MKAAKPKTLVGWLRQQAIDEPDHLFYTFLKNGLEETLTASQLDAQARLIASQISQSVLPGDPVILLYSTGLEFISAFFACLYAQVVAVPVCSYNFQMTKLLPWLEVIMHDVKAKLFLTTSKIKNENFSSISPATWAQGVKVIATDRYGEADLSWSLPDISPPPPAFLQYSFSMVTKPKRVMVTQEALMSKLDGIKDSFKLMPNEKLMSWLPMCHQVGLVGNVLEAVYSQSHLYFYSERDFIRDPLQWLKLISMTKTKVSGGPNYAYDLCTQHFSPARCEGLDLSSWELAYNATMNIRNSTLEKFAKTFSSYGFCADVFQLRGKLINLPAQGD